MHVLGGPDSTATYALSALLVSLLALVPGLGLAAGFGRRAGWGLPSVLCASFAFELGTVGIVSLGAYYAGLSLTFVLWASLAVLLLGGAAAVWPYRHDLRLQLGRGGLALGSACVALTVFEHTWFAQMADAFYHLAAVRSLLVTGRPMVTDPMFGTTLSTLDPTTGVWHTVLACWSRATGLDVATWLWPGAAAVGGAVTLMAFWVLCKTVSRSERVATAVAVAWLVLGLSADMRWAAYPNRLCLGLAFITLTAITSLADEPGWPDATLLVAAGFSTIAMHLAAAEMVVAAALVLLGFLLVSAMAHAARGEAPGWRPLAAVAGAGAVVAALAVPLVLPKAAIVGASPLVAFQSALLAPGLVRLPFGLLIDSPGHLMETSAPLFVLTTAIALLAAAVALRRRDVSTVAAAALAGLPAVLLTDPLLTPVLLSRSLYLTARVAILLPFTAFVAVAWAWAAPGAGRRARAAGRVLAVAVVVAAVVHSAAGLGGTWWPAAPESVWRTRAMDVRATWGADTLERLSAEFGSRYPTVAGDSMTSYYLAGVLPVSVVAVTSQHTAFAVKEADGPRRREDMDMLMTASTTEATRREILARRHAAYVIVPKYVPRYASALQAMRAEPDLLQPVVDTGSIVLFRVNLISGARAGRSRR